MANIYQNALDAQSAPNFYALVQSFARDLKTIRESNGPFPPVNLLVQHPVVVLYMTQLSHLTFSNPDRSVPQYIEAHTYCLEHCEEESEHAPTSILLAAPAADDEGTSSQL